MGKDSALKLYNALKSQGKYTKSFAEFQGILGDKQRSQKLYTALSNDGLYTKTFSDFSNQFGSGSETAHTTRTQTTTPKKTDFVADTINMLRTPSSQYTRPQQTQQTAPKRKWSNEVDVYSSMPDVVKQYAPTPTPLKTDSSVSMRSAATSTWNAADRAAREEYDRLHPKKEESFWERAARLMTDAEMGMGNENMEKATDMLASHYKTHDLQKLSDQAWNALGATQQKNITDEAYDELKRQYPQATEKELREAAAKVARAKSDETMYNLAVQKNMPDNAISFFARKMAEGNSVASLFTGLARQKAGTVGDLVAETEANERYGKKHKVAGIAGSVVGMASDPLTYAAGGVGGAATKGALWAGGKVLSEAAARKMSQTLGGKLLLGAVSGAANFGTFEAGGEAINQYKWGGTLDVDPETGRYVVGDFSLGKVASQMGHGLTMGGLTGAFGTWLGNVSTKAAQATSSTLGKLGVRAGELGVGLVGEGTIFATPEFISTYGDYNDVIKSVSDKNSPNYIADDKERSKYIAELKAQRGERMMDIWQDNLAMIAGFKAQHAIKSAGRTISELAASRRGKVGFVERMGRMLDGHPSLALSKEEQTELDKHGYGDLTQMVKEYKAYAQKDGDLPYNKITQLLNDKNVSEAARAKMYYYVTGHSLPMSAVIASNVIDNGDKTYTVQSLGDNGVITSRTYGSRKRADYEKARIDRQAELNGVAMAEQMFDNMDKAERLKSICTRLAQDKGVSPETLLWLTRKDPKQMTAAEKRWIKEIEDAANEDAPQGENATVRHIKGVIFDEYGVDVDKALRKAADSRTEAEETAISAYNNELAQAVAERKNSISQGETTDAYRRGYEADTQGMRDAYVAQMYEPSEDNAETLRGVESQITESAKYQAALERDELTQMTHKDGSIHLATLKEKDKDGNGKQVYIVDGDIVMKEDGSGIDADASSKSVIIYDPATGEKKMVSPTAVDGIESLGEVKTAEQREAEINAHMQDTIQRSKDWLEGNVANPVGMQIQLGDGRIATIEAMHEDGKSAIATLPDGTQFLVPKDVLQRIVNNGQYADYKARRDTESAPETATEGGQPLPEESSPKEEESREYAQGDVFDVVVDGNKMHAEIVSPKDADGRFVVNVDDGESMRTLYVTPEELAAMEYREEPSAKAEETRIATEGSSEKALERGEQPTEEHTPTALERIPRDEKGNAQFHDVDTETAWDGLVEMSGNEETAHKVAEASLANAERKLKAAKALKEKGETPEELLRSIRENEAAVAEAQRTVDAWKAIVGEKSRREEAAKAEAERIATEKAEAERKAAEERERAEAEEKTRIEAEKKEAERIAAEKAEEEARVEAERKAEEERKTEEEERKERDENGQPFVVSSDGTTTFGEITEDTGLTAAPIKLSEGVADEMGNGYGLRHIEARHGDQIRKAGFSSVEEFIEQVAKNYDVIKEGSDRNGNKTYRLLLTDKHNNTLMIELSKDGSYWNVNTAGVFKKSYGKDKKEVYNRHTTVKQSAETAETSQADEHSGTQSTSRMNVPTTSADKGTTLPADQQTSDKENTKKVADSEGENTLKAKIEAASADVNTEPTEAQKEAGNYKKGHVQVGTFDITIEQPEGSIRRGTDADGKKWESKMHNTYGYFRGTEGVDGDHIDVFLSNDIDGWNGRKVFVVDQYNPDGTFDEHKVMLGFNDMDEAKSDYLANYEKGWENGRRITVSTTNLEDFEKWIDSSHRKTKPFSEYSSVNKETVATDKGGEKAEKKQKKQSVFDKAKEIADKEEKKRKAEAEDDSALGQATRAVGKKKKVNLFKYTASKIISYPALRGVHYANGYAYASDGYILFKEKADYPKEWEGTTRDKDGNLIDGKYPDTEKAIHRLVHIPDKEAVSLPSKEVLDFAIAASKKLKGEAIPVAIDGLFFNAVNLKKFLEAVASKGMDKIVYRHPMLYATNGKDEIVMMPTVNTLEGALDIADKMESVGLPKEQIDAWKAHIEAADKKMSLEDFKKAVENAKKEGVRHTEAEKPKEQPLTEAERKDAEEVAGALGYRVEWVDTMEENGTIDADRKVIRIAKDAENPLVQVLGHEVAHGVRRMIGGKFRTLQKAAKEVVGEKEWNERIGKKRGLNAYAEGKLAEEVTCDIVGEALNDRDALKRLAESLRGERGILARLRDAVVRMVEYFKNRGDKEGVRRMKAADKLLAEFEGALKEDVASGQANTEGVDRSVRESGDEPENKRRKDFAERFGVDESYVSDYANGMAQKNTRKAARARRSMERQIYLANAGKTSKLSDIAKSLKPFRAALKEAFGDLDALIDEYRKLFEEERNMMEAARKKAEEEAVARKRHLDELSLLTEGQIDSRYAEALEKGDETEAREMLDEVARRKGYGDENNEYRMQHRAPSNPGYESDEARRNDIENGPDVNLEDIALGYNRQPDDYFTNPRGYSNDTPHSRESTDAVANALSSIRQGGRDVTVKVYRAVPTTMKEGKLRNGDWVSLSRRYAEMHGNHALNGKYRIMEDEVPAKDIWWDGNDVNEFGYDNGEDYKYKNVKNNRKSDDLVTRDDKGNVIPPSKRFNQRKADERYSRRESKELTAEERELRDNLVERMRKGGLDVVTDSEEMQRVIDRLNERTRMMGAKQKRALETATIAAEATNNATVISSADGAKIQNNLGTLATNYEKIANKTRGFITDLSHALGLKQHESSQYGTFETPDGKRITIRVSNHNARVSNFDKNNESEGISIVISSHKNKGLHNDGNAHIIEYFYPKRALENAEGKPLAEMIRSVSDALAGEEFKDTTGLAEREEVNGSSVREHRVYHGSGADFDAFDHSHMGEGEGAQAYGWGTYVTEVEGIGRTYAIQNTTKHNDALRALQHDVDAISDQLNRHRDDLKYDEEQLKRANEWRAEAELDYELFKNEAEELKEKYGESSPKYRNHLFNDIYTDEMKRAQSSVKSTEESIQYRKEKISELEKALKDKQAEIDELPKEFPRHLYTVEIPDDNGSNYLDWNGHPAESLLKDVGSFLESEGFERVQDSPVRYEKSESTVVLNPNATGADLYAELREALGSDKKASQALAELGCIGIKYPADNMRGGRKDGAKNYVIFNENDAKITDHTRFLRTAGGEVYGLVKDGRIYLDPKVATAETAVHEYTHLWGDMLRRKDSEQWSHTVKELKNSVLWEEVKELYPELKTDDEIADEVLSTFSGRRGAERLREEARRVAEGDGGVFTKAKAIETLERVKEAIARFWEGVARMFGINRYRSAEELADMAMRDLINGVKPTSRIFTFDNFYKDTKAVFEGTERPKGKPDYTSYSGSEYWYGEDKGGKYVVRGSDHWSGEFKVKDGERTNVGRNHYSEITEDGMLPIGAQGSLKFGWEKGLSKPVGSGISAAIDRRGSGDSNNIASCYWYIDNAKEKDNKGFTYGKAYLSEFEDKERRRDIPGDDWRDIQGLEGGTRAMAVKKANDRFNEELEMQVKGELEEGHVYKLGMPSEILLSTGVPNLPIELSAKQLSKKAANRGHRFDVKDIANLPQAIQAPIAVFEYGNKDKSQNLIVEIERDGKKFVVGIHFNQNRRGIVVNDIRGLFNKDSHEWLNWISQGKLLYADKEKIQALIDKQRTNLAEVNYLNLDDVAKKVKDFENPKLFGEEIIDDGKKGSDSTDRSVRENPKSEEPRFSRKPGESIFDYASRVSEDVDRSVRERVSARDEYEKKVKSKGFQTKEALQNSMLGLQEFMSAIDHASGNKRYIEDIPDFENPILGENRLSSVNKEEMHQVAKTQFKPLMSAVAKLSGNGKESGELYDYMFAKHGLERDAVMRQREAQKEFDKYQKANPKGTKTIGDFVASLEGKDYAGLTALTAEDGRVKSIQSQIDAIDEQMKATDDQLLLRYLGGQKKRMKVDLLNAARDAADDIRKTFENNPSHDRSDINELWSRVNEVNGNTLRKLYESGMLTKEAYNDISSMYTNYIPMRGFDQTTSADAYAYLTHGDSAFNAPIKTAKGRSSKADNPIAYMQAMAESAIMQGNRNVLVKQKMLNFVRNHPSNLASVSDVWLQYDSVAGEWKPVFPDNIDANDSASVVAQKMKAFEDKMEQRAENFPNLVIRSNEAPDIPYKVVEKGQLNEHQVLVKQNGKSYIITVNGSPRAAQAANGLTNPDTDLTGAVGKVFEGAEALNRQLSSLYTTLNPDFIGSNYVRDALYSNTMVYVKEGAKYGGSFNLNFAKYNPAEMANLYARYNKGSLDTSNETHRLFLEFMQNGGETGFVNLKQIEKRKSEIAKAIKRDGRISAAQIWGGLGDAVDFANRAVENSARFAAYVTSRKSGRSVGRSVYDAKEISVNFNRKGSGSKFMGAEGQTKAGNAAAFVSGAGRGLYIFWNAGLQGLTNFSRQIGRHPGRALTLASLLFGFGALMSYLGNRDDDDENNYFNLPKYIRRSNVCYKIGDLFVTIPLPVEYRSFYGLGELASSTLAGKEDGTTKDIAKEAVSQVSQLFPIDFAEGGGGLHALIPSAVKPIVEAETNTAWTGLPIYKDNDFNKNMPEYTKVYKTANGHLVEIARALNDATGGNKYKKGFIDINPAKMEYVLKGMLGGAFSFPDKLVKTTETIMGDREFDWRNTPFANRFVKNADERTEYKSLNEQYFKLKDEMDVVKQQLKGFEKEADAGNEKYEKALLQLEDSKDYERLELFKDYEKELKGLNDELKELRTSPDYDKAEEKELQKEIAELQRQLIDEMREIKK